MKKKTHKKIVRNHYQSPLKITGDIHDISSDLLVQYMDIWDDNLL